MTDEEIREWVKTEVEKDWTIKDGRSNSSGEFHRLVGAVERLIRGDAFKLIAGRADQTAGLIVAQLAHKEGLAPLSFGEHRGRVQERYDRTEAEPYSHMTGDEVREKDSDMALLRETLEDIDETEAAYSEVNE